MPQRGWERREGGRLRDRAEMEGTARLDVYVAFGGCQKDSEARRDAERLALSGWSS